jgi:hypothetical protein
MAARDNSDGTAPTDRVLIRHAQAYGPFGDTSLQDTRQRGNLPWTGATSARLPHHCAPHSGTG